MKTDQELEQAGFTNSGKTRYQTTTNEFCDTLFVKAVALGERDKALNAPREITHEHVRDAAQAIATTHKDNSTKVQIWCQVGEYVFTAAAGVGAAQLEHTWGIALFGISVAVGVVLFVIRNTQRRLP